MKRFIFSVILCGCLLLGVTGCGKDEEKEMKETIATIINNEGETEKLSATELCKIYNENEKKFNKYYVGAKVSFEGIVSSVGDNSQYWSSQSKFDIIWFEGGFKVYLPYNQYDIVVDLSEGDKLYVESDIVNGWDCKSNSIRLQGTDGLKNGQDTASYTSTSLMETVVRKAD